MVFVQLVKCKAKMTKNASNFSMKKKASPRKEQNEFFCYNLCNCFVTEAILLEFKTKLKIVKRDMRFETLS